MLLYSRAVLSRTADWMRVKVAGVLHCVCLVFIHLVVCLTTGPKPLPKRALHIVRSRASSFKWEYPLLSLRSFNSFLRFLPCLPVTSIPPCIFPSMTRCRRQFLRTMWPIYFAFRLRISCRIFLCSLTLSNTSSFLTWSVQLIFSILLQHQIQLYRLIYFSLSDLHVSGDVCARHQEHLTVFTVSGSVYPSCCQLVSWMSRGYSLNSSKRPAGTNLSEHYQML